MATKNWRHHDFNNLEVQQFTDGPVAFFGLKLFYVYLCQPNMYYLDFFPFIFDRNARIPAKYA